MNEAKTLEEIMFAIVDTETTGGNPAKDRIMEIAIILHDGEKTVEEFSTLVNPESPIAPFIIGLTGISNEMVADAPTFRELSGKIFQLTDKTILVAHNARFDYSMLRREFKKLGIRFQRKQICTVNLSKSLLPQYKSHSLGKLCREIGITVEKRHRALGDAAATAKLFELLMSKDREGILNHVFHDELEEAVMPPNLSKETVDDLPEETGLYYFLGKELEVLYVGKGRNIRKRVIDQITKEMKGTHYLPLLEKIHDVSFELTGSELVAQLMEMEEVKKYLPRFNASPRKKQYRYGIYHFDDAEGYINFEINKISDGTNPLIETASTHSARHTLIKLMEKYELEPAFCGMEKNENSTQQPVKEYNQKASRLLRKYLYDHPNFFIIGEGRSHHEQSIIWIENKLMVDFDIARFSKDIKGGLHFESTIPQGFGVGSSGALCAALYSHYVKDGISPEKIKSSDILKLKKIFSQLESYFHGKSSGIDPLICYLNLPILIKSKSDIGTVDLPKTKAGHGAIFLIDTGRPGRTQPLVQLFLEKCKQKEFMKIFKEHYIPYNDQCIREFLKGETKDLFVNLYHVSKFLLEYLDPMVPKLFRKVWEKGLETGAFYLKLCGSGGGGFLLGFTENLELAQHYLQDHQIKVIHKF